MSSEAPRNHQDETTRKGALHGASFHRVVRSVFIVTVLMLMLASLLLQFAVRREQAARDAAYRAADLACQKLYQDMKAANAAAIGGRLDPASALGRLHQAVTAQGVAVYRHPVTGGTINMDWSSGRLCGFHPGQPDERLFAGPSFAQVLLRETKDAIVVFSAAAYLPVPVLLLLWLAHAPIVRRRWAVTMLCMSACGLVGNLLNSRYNSLSSFWRSFDVGVGGVVLLCLSALCLWLSVRRLRERRPDCPQCRYSLIGNTSGICPECGTPVPESLRPLLAIPGCAEPQGPWS